MSFVLNKRWTSFIRTGVIVDEMTLGSTCETVSSLMENNNLILD